MKKGASTNLESEIEFVFLFSYRVTLKNIVLRTLLLAILYISVEERFFIFYFLASFYYIKVDQLVFFNEMTF
jgi:hypothetical protein